MKNVEDIMNALQTFNDILRYANDIARIGGELKETIDTALGVATVILAVPMLLNCFFGYRIQKFLITLGGILVGGLIGLAIGFAIDVGQNGAADALIPVGVLVGAIIGGFLAYKLWLVGLFFQSWLTGTIIGAALLILMGAPTAIGISPVIGLVCAILVVVFSKTLIIFYTGITGGFGFGTPLGLLIAHNKPVAFLISAAFAALGIYVQLRHERIKSGAYRGTATSGGSFGNPINTAQELVCPSCGVATAFGTRFCPNCGRDFTSPNYVAQSGVSGGVTSTANPAQYTVRTEFMADTYLPKSPIQLQNGMVVSRESAMTRWLRLKFGNVSERVVKSIYVVIECFDDANDPAGDPINKSYIDINCGIGQCFGETELIELSSVTAQRFNVFIEKIVMSDGETLRFERTDYVKLPNREEF